MPDRGNSLDRIFSEPQKNGPLNGLPFVHIFQNRRLTKRPSQLERVLSHWICFWSERIEFVQLSVTPGDHVGTFLAYCPILSGIHTQWLDLARTA